MRVRSAKNTQRVERKVHERLIPIVDEVVEMVFIRLKEAAARATASTRKKGSPRTKNAAASSSITENHDGLAGAVADLLLTALTHPPKRKRAASRKPPRTKRRSKV